MGSLIRGVLSLGILLFAFQNCSAVHEGDLGLSSTSGLPAGYTLEMDPVLKSQALAILSAKCANCHDNAASPGVRFILNIEGLVGAGLIVPGNPNQGRIIGSIAAGTMPTSGQAVTTTELTILKNWISSMTLTGTGPLPPPPPDLLPAGKTVRADTLLQAQAMTILNINCAGCHQGAVTNTFTSILNANNLVATGLVTVGAPASGRLIGAIVDRTMPKGSGARVTATDLQVLKNWITSMEIVDEDHGIPPVPPRPPLAATFSSIDANILQPKCYACHGAIKADADKRYDSYAAVAGDANDILDKAVSGEMPEAPYLMLTAEEIAAFTQWVNSGKPNN